MTPDYERTTSNTEGKHLGLALAVISAAQLMIVLDATIVNVALPTIHKGLHFSTANLEWLDHRLLADLRRAVALRWPDRRPLRQAPDVHVRHRHLRHLLAARWPGPERRVAHHHPGLPGRRAAIASPTALSLIATNLPKGRPRNRAMGVYAAMSGGGGAVGLLLGGILTDLVSWRWIFFVNVPIARPRAVPGPRALNESETTSGRLDVPGAVTATAGMLSLVYGVSNASSHSWASPARSSRSWWPRCCSSRSGSSRPAPRSHSCRCGSSPTATVRAPTP